MNEGTFQATPVAHVRSELEDPALAPNQGDEGAPDAMLVFTAAVAPALAQHGTPLLDRFFAPDARPLVSYRAFRHMTASTRGGKMTASMDVWTSLDPQRGFTYEITAMDGSGIIQKHVLLKALQAEQDAVQSVSNKAQSALSVANYEFSAISPLDARMVRVMCAGIGDTSQSRGSGSMIRLLDLDANPDEAADRAGQRGGETG